MNPEESKKAIMKARRLGFSGLYNEYLHRTYTESFKNMQNDRWEADFYNWRDSENPFISSFEEEVEKLKKINERRTIELTKKISNANYSIGNKYGAFAAMGLAAMAQGIGKPIKSWNENKMRLNTSGTSSDYINQYESNRKKKKRKGQKSTRRQRKGKKKC